MRIRHIKGSEEYIASDPFVIQQPEEYKGKWKKEVFGNDAPLFLEIGMGMGTFIRTHSFMYPENNYIGFELNTTVLYKAVKRYEGELSERGFDPGDNKGRNLRFIRSDARFLCEYFEDHEVDRIYLNFSDPWPKARHARRRLTSVNHLARYAAMLSGEGRVEFKTDNEALFDFSLESVEEAGWRLLECTRNLHQDPRMNEGNIMTEYEEKFSAQGKPICRLVAYR